MANLNLFLTKEKQVIKNIKGINIKFIYPTIADEIQIETEKTLLTRGQYPSLSFSISQTQMDAFQLTEALSTLKVVAFFVDKEYQEISWDKLYDEEGKDFLFEVYDEYLKWRNSFRKKDNGTDKEPQKAEEGNDGELSSSSLSKEI